MARPTKRTPQVQEAILLALRAGNTRVASALYVGIARETLLRWISRSVAFRHQVEQAEAQAEVRCVTKLSNAANEGDWRAALAWLERRRHEDWGRRDRIDLVQTVRVLAAERGLSDEETERAVAEAERYVKDLQRAHRSG